MKTFRRRFVLPLALLLAAVLSPAAAWAAPPDRPDGPPFAPIPRAPAPAKGQETATFAGGCFWCMETAFEGLEGVISVTSGYTGGHTENPTYEEVSAGGTGHAESVQVLYDPRKISYKALLDVFWHNVDPTTPDRQFCDVGSQYRSEIFTVDEGQRRLALASKKKIEASGNPQPIVTPITPLTVFYPAEEYHQDFYKKDPVRYKAYRFGCARDKRLEELWGRAPEHK